MRRSRFVAALAAASTLRAVPAWGQARLDFRPSDDDLKRFGDALDAVGGVARSWHAADQMPLESPLAFAEPLGPAGRVPLIWLNLDHRELATPRTSHADDEVPVIAATVAGLFDLGKLHGGAWDTLAQQLKALPPGQRSNALQPVARTLVQTYHVTLAQRVTDAEFDADAFPFAVVRAVTVGQAENTIAVDAAPANVPMPVGARLVAYVGRNDPRHPGVRTIWTRRDASRRVPGFPEAFTVAMILATADAQPDGSVRRAYDEARIADQRAGAGVYAARIAFAEPYIARVLTLSFKAPTPSNAPR